MGRAIFSMREKREQKRKGTKWDLSGEQRITHTRDTTRRKAGVGSIWMDGHNGNPP